MKAYDVIRCDREQNPEGGEPAGVDPETCMIVFKTTGRR